MIRREWRQCLVENLLGVAVRSRSHRSLSFSATGRSNQPIAVVVTSLIALEATGVDSCLATPAGQRHQVRSRGRDSDRIDQHRSQCSSGSRAGLVYVNAYGPIRPDGPYGGFKESGVGHDLGEAALEHYQQKKTVYVNLDEPTL